MKKDLRNKILTKRRNFLPSLIITIILWISVIAIVFTTDPKYSLNLFFFFILLGLSLLFTFAIIFSNKRLGIIFSLCITTFLILTHLNAGNVYTLIGVVVLGLGIEIYARFKK